MSIQTDLLNYLRARRRNLIRAEGQPRPHDPLSASID